MYSHFGGTYSAPEVANPASVNESGSEFEVVGAISGAELRTLILREGRLIGQREGRLNINLVLVSVL